MLLRSERATYASDTMANRRWIAIEVSPHLAIQHAIMLAYVARQELGDGEAERELP